VVTGEDVRALGIGVAGSLAAWFALQRVRIRYRWSRWISEGPPRDDGEPVRYAVKVRRVQQAGGLPLRIRRLRAAVHLPARTLVDVRVHVEFLVKAADPELPHNTRHIPLQVAREWQPRLVVDRLVLLEVADVAPSTLRRLPAPLAAVFADPAATVRDVLAARHRGIDVSLVAHVVGFDSFSGTRCVYSSERLTVDSIKQGRYNFGWDIRPWQRPLPPGGPGVGDD
jgi:hypothetical protein